MLVGEPVDARLIVCIGLPGSGKSTWAVQQVLAAPAGTVVRVNRDLLRTMLHADRFAGKDTEHTTVVMRDTIIQRALSNGLTVISDDTNFTTWDELSWVAEKAGCKTVLKDFTEVPLHLCLARNAKRKGIAKVPDAVIRRMHTEHCT